MTKDELEYSRDVAMLQVHLCHVALDAKRLADKATRCGEREISKALTAAAIAAERAMRSFDVGPCPRNWAPWDGARGPGERHAEQGRWADGR